jgi:hypothetical protein
VQPVSDTEMKTRVDAAVAQAMAGVEQRHTAETQQIKTDLEDARRRLLLAAEYYDRKEKRDQVVRSAGMYREPEEGK